jgi:ribosomal protein S18 acetylase RimI-like enzyme
MSEAVTFRTATEDDFLETWRVFIEAADDLARRNGWPPTVRPASPPARFLDFRRSALRHDPNGFWVAETSGAGRLAGFGVAVQREHIWYLAALHVRPAFQAAGIGGEIVRRSLAAARPASLLTVGADARNPVSNALYGKFGMYPQVPLLELSGPTRPARPGRWRLEPGAPVDADLAPLDRLVLDAARPEDHAFWGSTPAVRGYSVLADGAVAGYAYLQADGAIGPIAVASPDGLVPALDLAVGEAAALGASTAHVRIPGVARAAIADLLERGWRYGDGVTLVLSSAPWGRWEGYVTSGADALL